MHRDLPTNVKKAVEGRRDSILDDILWRIDNDQIEDFEGCYRTIDETHFEAAAASLDVDDQLTVLEYHGDDYGVELGEVSIGDLRARIEGLAAGVICSLGEGEAREVMRGLEECMDENDFTFEDLTTQDRFGWARHYAERDEGEKCQVYEYRNVEGSHVDMWEYRLTDDLKVYLLRFLEADGLTAEELSFDAS